MKNLLILILSFTSLNRGFAQDEINKFLVETNSFLQSFVKNGLVDYSSIEKQPQKLEGLVAQIEQMNVSALKDKEQFAFWINAYNLLVIKGVINHYPVKSPQEIKGFFDQISYEAGKEKLTLNEIENKKIRTIFGDERIHFVLVCAAKSCPPLIPQAYVPDQLENQLNEQTRLALNHPEFIRVNATEKKVALSEIFKWYGEDFRKTEKSHLEYINQFRAEYDQIPSNYKTEFYPYDWSLNDASAPETASERDTKKINIQSYTPSVLLKKWQFEFKHFNNLYTQKAFFNDQGERTAVNARQSFLTSLNQFLIGAHPQFNVGFDLWINSTRIDMQNSSPFLVYRFENSANSRTALSYLGPKVKIAPFRRLPRLSIQSTFLFPVAPRLSGNSEKPSVFVADDRYLWITQFFLDQSFGKRDQFQIFSQLSTWISFDRSKEPGTNRRVDFPLSLFFSYFPNKIFSVYVQNEIWLRANKDSFSYFYQPGAGAKLQIFPGLLELEASYTNFLLGKGEGAGQTFNFGIRIIR